MPRSTDGSPGRTYRSAMRDAQAARTRRAVLAAAARAFLDRGYAATTMRQVAGSAGVSVATVEQLFGTKARLLKGAIDVAIAGDDEPVAMLDRDWADRARRAADLHAFLDLVVEVLVPAQERSAGLVLAVFEGAARDPALAALRDELVAQRAVTAAWVVDRIASLAPLRRDVGRGDAIDSCWVLMDPAVYDRLVRHRGWSPDRYGRWFGDVLVGLLNRPAADHDDTVRSAP